jgi:hypothetical protein
MPTRRVLGNGALSTASPAGLQVPHYRTLTEALKAIDEDRSQAEHEVIQIEDSATYMESPVWPSILSSGAARSSLRRLTIQAAESARPVLVLAAPWKTWTGDTPYEEITLRGLTLGGALLTAPPAKAIRVQLCTVTDSEALITLGSAGQNTAAEVLRCVTAGLTLLGPGMLSVRDSIVGGGAGHSLLVQEGTCELARVTVFGRCSVRVLEATEVLFDGPVEVADRFRGCARYSRVPLDASLPRRHRLVLGTPARFVSRERNDPAYARLASDCAVALVRGAEDGSELGAFHGERLAQRYEALARRLREYTPAGLVTGILRMD